MNEFDANKNKFLGRSIITDGLKFYIGIINVGIKNFRSNLMKKQKYQKASMNLEKFRISQKSDDEPMINNWIGLDFGMRYSVAACKIDFRNPNERTNITIKKSALNECNRSHQKWLERMKNENGIYELERPIVRGDNEPFIEYWRWIMERYDLLSRFYNSSKVKRRNWFRERSFEGIFDVAIERLIKLAGDDINDVKFVLGDGNFSTANSLHSSFESKLIKKLIGLGYKVGIVDEAFTSCKCCRCHCFVEFITMRIKYCPQCDTYFHRDILGAENIIHAGKSVWLTGEKPDYLPIWKPPKDPPPIKLKIKIPTTTTSTSSQ